MIVDSGVQVLLQAQLSFLAGLEWGLFTSNLSISGATTFGDVVSSEASWTGYGRAAVSGYGTPVVTGGVATSNATGFLTFYNGSGSPVTFYGWFASTTGNILVAALNLGAQTIPGGANYSFAPAVTDQQTGP